MAALAGHGNIRGAVMGMRDGKPSDEEMKQMCGEMRLAMEAGAFGLSSGLIYDPGLFADKEELAGLSKVAAEYGGAYYTHIRDESSGLVSAVQEAIDVGRLSGAPVQISHHKVFGKRNHGLVKMTLDLMEYYNTLGNEITCDLYPCLYCATDLYSFFPLWTRESGRDGFIAYIKDPEKRRELTAMLKKPGIGWENGVYDSGLDDIIITSSTIDNVIGKSIAAIAGERGEDAYETMYSLLEQDIGMLVISGGISEDDVRYVLSHPLSMIGSDGNVCTEDSGLVHPRAYRAFTKTLTQYTRDEGLLTLPDAVSKMSRMAAWKMGIYDRGIILPGMRADLFIFDYYGTAYRSEFSDPHHYSEGAVHVLVNGEFVIKNSVFTKNRPGMVLRKNAI
jgi:N-acyl-D-amino-acid deacylase